MKHAEVEIGEYKIPLIGIPPKATEYECDLCHNIFSIRELKLSESGSQFLCKKCLYESK